jgi:hypothetical protein
LLSQLLEIAELDHAEMDAVLAPSLPRPVVHEAGADDADLLPIEPEGWRCRRYRRTT